MYSDIVMSISLSLVLLLPRYVTSKHRPAIRRGHSPVPAEVKVRLSALKRGVAVNALLAAGVIAPHAII